MADETRDLLTRYVAVRLANRVLEELGDSEVSVVNNLGPQNEAARPLVLSIELLLGAQTNFELLRLLEELAEGREMYLQLGMFGLPLPGGAEANFPLGKK